MTVKELIEKLSQFDETVEVVYETIEDGFVKPEQVSEGYSRKFSKADEHQRFVVLL